MHMVVLFEYTSGSTPKYYPVTAAMDQIIAKNIFVTSGGDLVGKDSAQIVDRTVNVIYQA